MLTVLIPVAAIALVVILGVLAFQRGRDGLDLSPGTLLRGYLYLGSFAGIVALAFGLSALLNGALASAVGNQLIYGGQPSPAAVAPLRPCLPDGSCPPSPDMIARQQGELERRRQEDLVRGLTFAVFGGLFYGAHRAARHGTLGAASVGDHGGLRRAYLLLGTTAFGIASIALLPAGLYQLLANALVTAPADVFRPGVSDNLSSGFVCFAIWLLFLRATLSDARGGGAERGEAQPLAERA